MIAESIAPSLARYDRIGSKMAFQPPAPFVVAPALLEARDFSNTPGRLAIGPVGTTRGLAAPR